MRQAAAELQQASGVTSPAAGAAAAADSSSSREAERALQALLAAVGAGSVQQAAVAHQDMKQLQVLAMDGELPALDAA